MAADLKLFLYAYKLAVMTSLSWNNFPLKRGHKGQFICIEKNMNSVAIF